MQHMLLMISSEAPGDDTAVEPARTPIREPELDDMHVSNRVDGKVLSRSQSAI